MKRIMIINGPNLNLLGLREPDIYGHEGFASYLERLRLHFASIEIGYFQSNVEGEIINQLQAVGFSYDGIVLNAGGYSHTSVAIRDAVSAISTPVVEVHISNIFAREEFRHRSVLSDVCRGGIFGLGLDGYKYAIESLVD